MKYHGKTAGLHKVWDGGVGAFEGESTTEHAMEISTSIRSAYPKSFFGDRADDTNPENWAKEGMDNAKNSVYNTDEDGDVSENYITAGQKLAEQEAALAGYRLAALLNELLA